MQVVIFDDISTQNFYPLTHTRSTGDLRCGILKLRQRLQHAFEAEDSVIVIDPRLERLYRERHPDWQINSLPEDDKLYLNSRIRFCPEVISEINSLVPETCLCSTDGTIALRSKVQIPFGDPLPEGILKVQSKCKLYNNIADIVHDNVAMIKQDFEDIFYEADNYFETEPGVTVLNPYNIWIGENVTFAPNVVLDASEGPIVIDEGARVMANSVITGPCYIGKKSLIKIGAKIYGGVSIGAVCKIGGEVEGSIFLGYSNKQHDGFLGHAYIGEWVNLGADTNNSDLKNTYKNVKIYSYPLKTQIDSQTRFMGCVVGDHVKTGINTSLNTGVVVGTGSNIYGSKLFSAFVPDFSWGEADQLLKYRLKEFLTTAGIVKGRRSIGLSKEEIMLFEQLYGE